jgi:hypothetical protein
MCLGSETTATWLPFHKFTSSPAQQEEQPAWSSTDYHNGAFMQHSFCDLTTKQHSAQQKGSNWPDTFMPQ